MSEIKCIFLALACCLAVLEGFTHGFRLNTPLT